MTDYTDLVRRLRSGIVRSPDSLWQQTAEAADAIEQLLVKADEIYEAGESSMMADWAIAADTILDVEIGDCAGPREACQRILAQCPYWRAR